MTESKVTEWQRQERLKSITKCLKSTPQLPPQWTDTSSPEFRSRVNPELVRFAQHHNPSKHGSAILLGPSGCGKTLSSLALLRRRCADAIAAGTLGAADWMSRALWLTGHGLALARRRYGLGTGESPDVERAMKATLLVVDEVGYEPQTEVIFEVVDFRYSRRFPTIVTSGLEHVAFVERYGDAFFRRLAGAGCGVPLDLHKGTR